MFRLRALSFLLLPLLLLGAAPGGSKAPGRSPYGVQFGLTTPVASQTMNSAWTVLNVPWSTIEPTRGVFTYAVLDDQVRQYAAVGVQAQVRLTSCAVLSTGARFWGTYPVPAGVVPTRVGEACTNMPPLSTTDWYDAVFSLVSHVRGLSTPVRVFAIDNEVNDPRQWPGRTGRRNCVIGPVTSDCPVFDDYVATLRTARAAAHAADPAALVLDGGLGGPSLGNAMVRWKYESGGRTDAALRQAVTFLNTYFSNRHGPADAPVNQYIDPTLSAAAMRTRFTSVFYAPYRPPTDVVASGDRAFYFATHMYNATDTIDAVQLHFYDYPPFIQDVAAFMRLQGVGTRPIYCWECGIKWPVAVGTGRYLHYDPAVAAAWVTQKAQLAAANGIVQVLWVPMAWTKAPAADENNKNLPLLCNDLTRSEPALCPAGSALSGVGTAFRALTK